MALFLDTSAIVKLFVAEHDSDTVDRLVATDPMRWIGGLTSQEFHSAVYRRIRMESLTESAGRVILDRFNTGFLLESSVIHLHPAITNASMDLIRKHGPSGLRILDSLQLACCLSAAGARMVVADGPLAKFAESEGVEVIRVGGSG